jgi:hypothetical protein
MLFLVCKPTSTTRRPTSTDPILSKRWLRCLRCIRMRSLPRCFGFSLSKFAGEQRHESTTKVTLSCCWFVGFSSILQVRKKAGTSGKPVREVLWCAAAAARVEWYMNTARLVHQMQRSRLTLLPAGTTSNKALHAEVNPDAM